MLALLPAPVPPVLLLLVDDDEISLPPIVDADDCEIEVADAFAAIIEATVVDLLADATTTGVVRTKVCVADVIEEPILPPALVPVIETPPATFVGVPLEI